MHDKRTQLLALFVVLILAAAIITTHATTEPVYTVAAVEAGLAHHPRVVSSLSLMPLARPHAARLHGGGSGSIVLRYHFVAGQRLLYRVTTTSRVTNRYAPSDNLGAGLASSQAHFGPVTGTFLVRAQVVRVDATRTATIAESIYRVDGSIALRDAATISIAPNGTQRRISPVTRTSLTIPLTVALSRGPVRPGTHWTSTILMAPVRSGQGAMLSRKVTVDHTLAGFGIADGEPVAIIRGVERSQLRAVTIATVSGQALREQEDEKVLVTEHALFGLASGDLVSSQTQLDSTLTIQHRQPGETGTS